jgi:hypothetical protein
VKCGNASKLTSVDSPRMYENHRARLPGDNFLLSLSVAQCSHALYDSGISTAPTATGPAKGPRPASSIPIMNRGRITASSIPRLL